MLPALPTGKRQGRIAALGTGLGVIPDAGDALGGAGDAMGAADAAALGQTDLTARRASRSGGFCAKRRYEAAYITLP